MKKGKDQQDWPEETADSSTFVQMDDARPILEAASSQVLGNAKIKLTVSEDGSLESVENLLASETYAFSSDVFALDTDLGLFSNRTTKPALVTADGQRMEYRYEFRSAGGADKVDVSLLYTLGPEILDTLEDV